VSWAGLCPGRQESAEHNHSSRSPKGNKFLRRILTQAAQAAVKKKGSYFQIVFRKWMPRLGYQAAIWAIAHKLGRVVWKILHDGVSYIERGEEPNPIVRRRRANRMVQALRRMGYRVEISSLSGQPI
jgi:transposase